MYSPCRLPLQLPLQPPWGVRCYGCHAVKLLQCGRSMGRASVGQVSCGSNNERKMWIANIEHPQSTTRRIFGSFQIALGRKCHGSSPSCARMRASPSYANTAALQSAVCSCRLTIMTARNGHADRFRSPQSHGSARDASRFRPGITDSETGSPYSWRDKIC